MSASAHSYRDFQQQLLRQFILAVQQQPPFIDDHCAAEPLAYLHKLEALPQLEGSEYHRQGQEVLCQTIAAYPHLTPLIPRDLLWHFGGDCLHFMPDEEIDSFQQLDEAWHEAQSQQQDSRYEDVRAKLKGPHG